MLRALADWFDNRTGYRQVVERALLEPVKGGSSWRYVFGSALTVSFCVQAITGVALALYYSPSTTDAWASVNYIQQQVYLGWLLRGMHHFGASAMVVLLVLHLLQTAFHGAFRAPREVNWLTGFMLLQLVLAFALTGYLLPWDQKGYWATQVATSIAATVPLVGQKLHALLVGGPEYGNLTLTRFFALHVFVLPAALIGFLVVHVALFRKHGVTPPPSMPEAEARRRAEPFFPGQLFKDTAFSLVVVGVVFALAWREHGAPLAAPADPGAQYLARPEWYFLPLFQLLKYFEGPLEPVGTVIVPGVAMGLLAALPFLHALLKSRTRRAHGLLLSGLVAGVAAVAGLGVLAVLEDAKDPAVRHHTELASREAAEARRLAAMGVPVTGPQDLVQNDPLVWGERLFAQHCATCHQDCSVRPYKGDPCLAGYGSRLWLSQLIRKPDSPLFFGNTDIDEMDAYTGSAEKLRALVEFVYGLGGRADVNQSLAVKGKVLFSSEGCEACHSLDGVGNGIAPDLKGYASEAWLANFIRDPGAERFYGDGNQMEAFDHEKLSPPGLQAVISHLRTQAERPVKFAEGASSKPRGAVEAHRTRPRSSSSQPGRSTR